MDSQLPSTFSGRRKGSGAIPHRCCTRDSGHLEEMIINHRNGSSLSSTCDISSGDGPPFEWERKYDFKKLAWEIIIIIFEIIHADDLNRSKKSREVSAMMRFSFHTVEPRESTEFSETHDDYTQGADVVIDSLQVVESSLGTRAESLTHSNSGSMESSFSEILQGAVL